MISSAGSGWIVYRYGVQVRRAQPVHHPPITS